MLKRFVRDMAAYMPSMLLPALTAFITTPILTRLFSPAEYGYWSLALGVSSFLVGLAASGYGSAVLRYYPAYKARSTLSEFFNTIIVSAGAGITLLSILSLLVLSVIRRSIPSALYALLKQIIILFIVHSIYTLFISVIRAQGRSGAYTVFQMLMHYGSLGIGLFLVVVCGFRVDGLIWGSIAILIVLLPFLIGRSMKGLGIRSVKFNLSDARQMWQYAWPLTLASIALWALRMSDLFIISSFRPERDVGLYSVSYSISARSIEILVSLSLLSMSPLVYRTWESEGRKATEKNVTRFTRVYLMLCLPAAVGLTVLASPFVALLAAPEYLEGSRIVGFVVFSAFLWGLSDYAMLGLAIKQKARRLGANVLIASCFHVFLQLLLVPRFGYVASAISSLFGYGVLLALHTITSRPHLTWLFPYRTLRNVLAASGVMGLMAFKIYRMSGVEKDGSIMFLFLSIAAALPTYIACLWFLGEIQRDEKMKAIQYCRKIFNRGL